MNDPENIFPWEAPDPEKDGEEETELLIDKDYFYDLLMEQQEQM